MSIIWKIELYLVLKMLWQNYDFINPLPSEATLVLRIVVTTE